MARSEQEKKREVACSGYGFCSGSQGAGGKGAGGGGGGCRFEHHFCGYPEFPHSPYNAMNMDFLTGPQTNPRFG